jgi:hypothetical protein
MKPYQTLTLLPLETLNANYQKDVEQLTKPYLSKIESKLYDSNQLQKELETKQAILTETYLVSKNLMLQIGDEHAGTYVIHVLSAKEYLEASEDLIQQKRLEAQKVGNDFNGQISEIELRRAIVYKAVTKNGKQLPDDLPSKLYELLAVPAVQANMLTQEEGRELFKLFRDPPKN